MILFKRSGSPIDTICVCSVKLSIIYRNTTPYKFHKLIRTNVHFSKFYLKTAFQSKRYPAATVTIERNSYKSKPTHAHQMQINFHNIHNVMVYLKKKKKMLFIQNECTYII